MPRTVAWTLTARQDLLSVVQHLLEQEAPGAAARLIDQIEAAAGALDELSERGRAVPELGLPRRELIVGGYRLVYRVRGDEVQILRLIHGRQNFISSWRKTPQ